MIKDWDHYKEWSCLNERMKQENFTWGSLPEKGQENQYTSLDIHKINSDTKKLIDYVTKGAFNIAQKTVNFLQKNPELFPILRLPENTWNCVTIPNSIFSYFTRLDLVVNGDDIKVLEFNCDTPTGFLESSVGNRIACDYFKTNSPNKLENAIFEAFKMVERDYGLNGDEKIYFTSYDWHEEDRQTTEFIRRNSGLPNTEYIGLKNIVVKSNGVFTPDGSKIEYLYRLYPLEYLSDNDNHKVDGIGDMMLHHISTGNLKIINPPSAFLAQVKSTMAVIWTLHEANHELFTSKEHDFIESYFLPTYIDSEVFEENGLPYVAKPIFGREGGGVTIFDRNNEIVAQDTTNEYFKQNKIFQKYIEMPNYTIKTWEGNYTGSLLTGSFVIGGEPAGIFLRVGTKITGNLSMFLPVTVA